MIGASMQHTMAHVGQARTQPQSFGKQAVQADADCCEDGAFHNVVVDLSPHNSGGVQSRELQLPPSSAGSD